MAAKIIAATLTLLIDAAGAFVLFFLMLIMMNGFSESDATPGLITYIVLSIATCLLMALAAFLTTGLFIKRNLSPAASAALAVSISAIIGGVIIVVSCFIGIGVADYVRVNY